MAGGEAPALVGAHPRPIKKGGGPPFLFYPHAERIEFVIDAALFHKLFVRSLFCNAILCQHEDEVCPLYGGKAERKGTSTTPLGQGRQGLPRAMPALVIHN